MMRRSLRSAATSVGRNYSSIETKRPLPLLFDGKF
jgi:hypothetical protein